MRRERGRTPPVTAGAVSVVRALMHLVPLLQARRTLDCFQRGIDHILVNGRSNEAARRAIRAEGFQFALIPRDFESPGDTSSSATSLLSGCACLIG